MSTELMLGLSMLANALWVATFFAFLFAERKIGPVRGG